MNSLAMYGAMVDGYSRTIVFAIQWQDMFIVAMTCLKGGSITHLYYIQEETSEGLFISLDLILVVRDYTNMF